jgi:hypothetical protein
MNCKLCGGLINQEDQLRPHLTTKMDNDVVHSICEVRAILKLIGQEAAKQMELLEKLKKE